MSWNRDLLIFLFFKCLIISDLCFLFCSLFKNSEIYLGEKPNRFT